MGNTDPDNIDKDLTAWAVLLYARKAGIKDRGEAMHSFFASDLQVRNHYRQMTAKILLKEEEPHLKE